MGTTSQGIVYPDPSSPIAGLQSDFQTLAETVDVALAPGTYSVGDLGLVTAPGWDVTSFQGTRIGIIRCAQLVAERTGGTITGGGTGNIADVNVLQNFPVDWRPTIAPSFSFNGGNGFGTGDITLGGVLRIVTFSAGATLNNGNSIRVSAIWLVA